MLARAVRAPAARLAPHWCRQMAVQKFPVPEMGDSISEGTVLELSKQVGDYVALEEVLVVVETDKVTVDVRSPAAGTITKWFANPDDTIEVGSDLIEARPPGPRSTTSAPAHTTDEPLIHPPRPQIDVGVGEPAPGAAPPPAPAAAAPAAPPAAAAAPAPPPPAPAGGRIHPGGAPSLIRFRSQGGPAAAAAPAGAPKMGAPPVGVSVDELPARFRRAPMSEDEMEAVMSGGASVSDWAWVKIRW